MLFIIINNCLVLIVVFQLCAGRSNHHIRGYIMAWGYYQFELQGVLDQTQLTMSLNIVVLISASASLLSTYYVV